MNKRFIVTVADGVDSAAALEVVSEGSPVRDAVMAFATDDYDDASDVLTLKDLGIYLKTMSEEDASTVRKDERVLAVEEDLEVFALNHQGDHEYENGADESSATTKYFTMGYFQALADMGVSPSELVDCYGQNGEPIRSTQSFWKPSLSGGRHTHRVPRHPMLWPSIPQQTRSQQAIPWNIAMVGADKVWARTTGRGVKVGILDTGIDEDHPDLIVHGGVSFVPNVSSWDDDDGHGTHCAGIVAARNNAAGVVGVAPDAELYAVKVLPPPPGKGKMSWVISGMGWCARNGIRVASLSLGRSVAKGKAPFSVAYQKAAERLQAAGCLVVAAAGNSGDYRNYWVWNPARCPGFMAVAAVDRNGERGFFSSWGPPSLGPLEGIEIAAPGVRVCSTFMNGGYATKSGTSMACPHVSGAAALIAQMRPTWTPAQIRTRLKVTARDLGTPGDDPKFGAGLLDCLAAIS